MNKNSEGKSFSDVLGHKLERERELTWLLHDVHWLLSRQLGRKASEVGLSKAKWRVLVHLSRGDVLTQTALAEEMGVEKAPLGRILEKLEDDGLIERKTDPNDRRAKLVYATDSISPLADHMIDIASKVFDDTFRGIGEPDLEQLKLTMKRIRENLSS